MIVVDGVDMVDVREAAGLVGRTPETVRRWVWSGRVEAIREGNRLLIRRADVARLGENTGSPQPLSLAEWAARTRKDRGPGGVGISAADLVIDDRAERGASGARR